MTLRLHHLNIVVRDLDSAIDNFRAILEAPEPIVEALPERGVRTARFDLHPGWLVLVEPVDPDSLPARHLATRGEGLFLLSLCVDDLQAQSNRLTAAGLAMDPRGPRDGLADWRVADIDDQHTCGAVIQYCQAGG